MAIIKRGILGGFSGKVGNVVGTSWKGIAVMKVKPLSVANPKTAGQVNQRGKFKHTTLAGSALLSTICKPLWDREAQQMSGYNAFVKNNINAFDKDGVLTVANFKPTLGVEVEQPISSVDIPAGDTAVAVDWLSVAGNGKALGADEMQIVVFNETKKEFGSVAGSLTRADNSATVLMPSALEAGDVISVWLTARSADHVTFFSAGSDLSGTVQ